MALYTVANSTIEAILTGKPLRMAAEDENAKEKEKDVLLSDAVRMLLANMRTLRTNKLTFADDEQALLVAQALRGSVNGTIVFEETPYKWLKDLMRAEGSKLFSPNTANIVSALEAAQVVTPAEVAPKPDLTVVK